MEAKIKEVDATVERAMQLREEDAAKGNPWIGVVILGVCANGQAYLGGSTNVQPVAAAMAATLAREFAPGTAPVTKAGETWGYSDSPEPDGWIGTDGGREGAIEEGLDTYPDAEAIYVIRGRTPDVAEVLPNLRGLVDHMLDGMQENAFDLVGDVAEDFPDVTDAAREELATALGVVTAGWASRHVQVAFWVSVGKAERIERAAYGGEEGGADAS